MKQENKKGALPPNIDEIIDLSLIRIDIHILQIWLCNRKIKIKVKNEGLYKTPSQEEIKEIISDAIRKYYFDSVVEDSCMYEENIHCIGELHMGGISLKNEDSHFKIDFDLITPRGMNNQLFATSYLSELYNNIRYN